MPLTVEAVYEQGVFKPLEHVRLQEGQRVELSVQPRRGRLTPAEMEALAARVYEGLSDEDVGEIEAMALDRSSFIRPLEPDGTP